MADLTTADFACDCEHDAMWHHERRGCGYFGHGTTRACRCSLTSIAAVEQIVARHVTAALTAVADEVEADARMVLDGATGASLGYRAVLNEGITRAASIARRHIP